MNNVVLMGRLTREPELRYLQGGNNTAVARFTIAVDKSLSKEKKQELESKNQPTADFINCVAYGKQAETIAKFTGKGLRLAIVGRLNTYSYETLDGEKKYATDIVINHVEFVDWKEQQLQNVVNEPMDEDFALEFDTTENDRIPF